MVLKGSVNFGPRGSTALGFGGHAHRAFPLLTKSEKEKLLKDAYMVSLYPEAYEGYPKAFRERLRKNKSIVDDRELEKIVKGKFSVKEKVGF